MNKCDSDSLFITDKHVFFFGSVFSNFHKCKFTYSAFGETHEFFCTEQAFMWHKAMLFSDSIMSNAILNEKDDPLECKHCGRWVQGYDDETWNKVRYDVMLAVNIAKFTQCKDLNDFIKQPKFDGKTFVEASPSDCIWGIGIAIGVETIDKESTWKGQNLLGTCITEVRNKIMKG